MTFVLRLVQWLGVVVAVGCFTWLLNALFRIDEAASTGVTTAIVGPTAQAFGWLAATSGAVVVGAAAGLLEERRTGRVLRAALESSRFEIRARPIRALLTLGGLTVFFAYGLSSTIKKSDIEHLPTLVFITAASGGCFLVLVLRMLRRRSMLSLTAEGLQHAWTREMPWASIVGMDVRIHEPSRAPHTASLHLCVRNPVAYLDVMNVPLRWLPLFVRWPAYAHLRVPLHGLSEPPRSVRTVLQRLRGAVDAPFLAEWDSWMPMAVVAAEVRVLDLEIALDTTDARANGDWGALHQARLDLERVRRRHSGRVIRAAWVAIGGLSLAVAAMVVIQTTK